MSLCSGGNLLPRNCPILTKAMKMCVCVHQELLVCMCMGVGVWCVHGVCVCVVCVCGVCMVCVCVVCVSAVMLLSHSQSTHLCLCVQHVS